MYNSTQAQPQVPTTSPWNKAKKKPRPNGSDPTLDEEAGFIQTDADSGHDLYLDGVNLSPSIAQQQQPYHPITATPVRRDRSLSPTNNPVTNANTNSSVVRSSEQMPRSAPASPQKNRPSSAAIYQQQQQPQYTNGYNHHHHHQHPEIRR